MARPSKLSEKQWAEVERRHIAGESIRGLAKIYKVGESAIRARISAQSKDIKDVARQIVEVEEKFNALPVNAQITAHNLANQLRSISMHLGNAANYGAMTAHRLAGIANAQVDGIDDADPLKDEGSFEKLKGISALTKLANDSAEIGLNLLKANKETVDGLNKQDDQPEPKQIVFTVQDASA